MEIQEIIRRWQAGHSQRQIAAGAGVSRDTVRRYLAAAQGEGIAGDGPTPTDDQLSRLARISRSGPRQSGTPGQDLLEPWGGQIYRWLTVDRLQMTRIKELLDSRGCPVSYPSLRRFILKRNWRKLGKATVRMEDIPPGEVAELDFGRLGYIEDQETGRRCTVWALLVVLAHSRHSFRYCFLWPTCSQKLEEVIAGLEASWAFFGGIPKYLVIDNFPAAVAGADALHPRLTRGFLEYSQHRGFSPIRPGCVTPGTSPGWSGASNTSGNASSRAGTSRTWPTSEVKQLAGAEKSLDRGSTEPPSVSPCRSFWMRSVSAWRPGTASPTRSPTGAAPRCILTTTCPVSTPFTRCRRPCAPWAAGGDRAGPQAGAHLPPGSPD